MRDLISEELCQRLGVVEITITTQLCPKSLRDSTSDNSSPSSNYQLDTTWTNLGNGHINGIIGIGTEQLVQNEFPHTEFKWSEVVVSKIDSLGRFKEQTRKRNYSGFPVFQFTQYTNFNYDSFGALVSLNKQFSEDVLEQNNFYRKVSYRQDKRIKKAQEFNINIEGKTPLISYSYKYDKHGNVKKKKSILWTPSQKIPFKETIRFDYKYNKTHQIEYIIERRNNVIYKKEYSYSPEGNFSVIKVTQKDSYSQHEVDTLILFNQAGLITEKRVKQGYSNYFVTNFEYDENKLIRKITYFINNNVKSDINEVTLFEYNDLGLIKTISTANTFGPTIKFSYVFEDPRNN